MMSVLPMMGKVSHGDRQEDKSAHNVITKVTRCKFTQKPLGYSELLDACNLPTLENRRLYMKLCHLFKVVLDYAIFHQALFSPRPTLHTTSGPIGISNHNNL